MTEKSFITRDSLNSVGKQKGKKNWLFFFSLIPQYIILFISKINEAIIIVIIIIIINIHKF